jgi:hypothetical protein
VGKTASEVLPALVTIAVIVNVDLVFCNDEPWERLAAKARHCTPVRALYIRFVGSS